MLCPKCKSVIPDSSAFRLYCGKKQSAEPRKHIKRANGTGTVYKLTDQRRRRPWVAAKNGEIIGYYEKRQDAAAELDSFSRRSLNERFNFTFRQVYEHWKVEHFREIGVKGEEGYKTAYAHCAPLYDAKFRTLRTSDFQAVVDSLADAGRKRATQDKLRQLLNQLSLWAVREEIITTNYAQFLRLLAEPKKDKTIFGEDEIKLLEASPSDVADIVLIMIYTGMRIGEMFSVKTTDCHADYCIGGIKTEAGRNRVIPIPAVVSERYRKLLTAAGGHELLIDGYTGNRAPDNFRKRDYPAPRYSRN